MLDGAFVWARRALNRQKRRFPARAVVGAVLLQAAMTAVQLGLYPIVTLENSYRI
jgi:hypothetical protein